MHKHKVSLLLFLILFLLNTSSVIRAETSKKKADTVTVKILPQRIHYSKMILGFNTNLSNAPYRFNYPSVINRFLESGARYVRFPGGNIANLYDWRTGLEIGFRGMGEKFSRNVKWSEKRAKLYGNYYKLDYFLDFLSKTKTNFSIVLNILSLTPKENAQMLKYIKSKGFNVRYVEIGNEIYNKPYRVLYPTAKSYIERAKSYAGAVKTIFPKAKIGLTIPPIVYRYSLTTETDKLKKRKREKISKAITWYKTMHNYSFYNAIIIHLYNVIRWNRKKTIKDFYTEAMAKSNEKLLDRTFMALKSYFPNKEVWVTEWNSGLKYWLREEYENTYAKALYAADFIRKMLLQKQITIAGLHNFPNLFYPRYLRETKYNMLPPNKPLKPTPKFYVFKLLKEAIITSSYVSPINISGEKYFYAKTEGKTIKLPELTGLYFSGKNSNYLLIINRWKHSYTLNYSRHTRITKTLVSKSLTSRNASFKTQKLEHNAIEILPYSINLIK